MERRCPQLEIPLAIRLLIRRVGSIPTDLRIGKAKLQFCTYKVLSNRAGSLVRSTFRCIKNISDNAGNGLEKVDGNLKALLIKIILPNAIHKMRLQCICNRIPLLIVKVKRLESSRHQQSEVRSDAQRATRSATALDGELARLTVFFENLLYEPSA